MEGVETAREVPSTKVDRTPNLRHKGYLEAAGLPSRYMEADLDSCAIYRSEERKQKALVAAVSFAKRRKAIQRDRTRSCILLAGDFGVGKTWLASAIFREISVSLIEEWRDKQRRDTSMQALNIKKPMPMWRKFYTFVREVQATYSPRAEETSHAVLTRYQTTPLLLLDDVGDLEKGAKETDDRRRLLYEVLDARCDNVLPTILTTNLKDGHLKEQFGERTFQRLLEMCAMYEMNGKNLRIEDIDD